MSKEASGNTGGAVFEAETRELVLLRIRSATWLGLGILALFAVADVVLSRAHLWPLLALKTGQVALLLALLAALRTQRGRARAVPLTLALLVPFSANLALSSYLIETRTIPMLEFSGIAILLGAFVPWGAAAQAVAAGTFALAILGYASVAGGMLTGHFAYSELGSLAFLVTSVYLAAATRRHRLKLFSARQEALRAQERFRDAVEASPAAMLVADRQGQIVLVNRNLEQMFGYGRQELIGKSIELLVPEHLRAAHREQRDGFTGTPHMRAMGAGRDLVGLCKDGRVIPVEIGLNPFSTEEGSFVLAALIDISERKRAEQALAEKSSELARANKELTEANTIREYFAATMAHELRSVFMVLTGYADLLREATAGNAPLAEMLDAIQRRSREGQDIINSALEISRPESEPHPHRQVRVSLAHLFDEVVLETSALRSNVEVQLDWQLPEGLDVIRSEPRKLKMILRNLVENAVKFTSRGNIRLSAAPVADGVELVVQDTGTGIAADTLPFVFEPFRQGAAKRARMAGGVGLGLFLVKQLVERLGGDITVESTENVGTTFRIRLPTAASTHADGLVSGSAPSSAE